MSIREMKEEISGYNVPKRISDAMLELARIGFKPSGHGAGMGSEDWSIGFYPKNEDLYSHVTFNWDGSKIETYVSVVDDANDIYLDNDYSGVVSAIKFIKKHKLNTKRGINTFIKDKK